MSGNGEIEAQPAASSGEPAGRAGIPAGPPGEALAPPTVDLSLGGPIEASGRAGPLRKRLIAAGVALTVVAAFAIVASVSSAAGGIHSAFSSVFSSPTVKLVVSAHSRSSIVQAELGRYSLAVTMTSENSGQEVSGADGRIDYESSVLRGSVDLADVIVIDHTIYVRVDVQAIDPSAYESELRSLITELPPGPTYDLAVAFLHHKWVGIDGSTIESLVKSFEHGTVQRPATVKVDKIQSVFTLSFAQAWDAWTSSRQVSSDNGVSEYSVKLPVEHFFAAYLSDVRGALLKDLPSSDAALARRGLRSLSSTIKAVPAGLDIPITLWVTNGSLSRVEVSYKGDSVSLAISHPAVGVTAPAGAAMVTISMLRSLLGNLGLSSSSPLSGSAGSYLGGSSSSPLSGSAGSYLGGSSITGSTGSSLGGSSMISSTGISGSSSSPNGG